MSTSETTINQPSADQPVARTTTGRKIAPGSYTPKQGSGVKQFGKRKIRLTDQVKAEILIQLRRGCHLETAFAYARIPGSTFRNWISQAKESVANAELGKPITKRRKELVRFLAEVEQAQAEAEARAVGIVHSAMSAGSFTAALSFLERRFPERWAKRNDADVNVNVAVGFGYVELSNPQGDPPIVPAIEQPAPQSPIPESHQLTTGSE